MQIKVGIVFWKLCFFLAEFFLSTGFCSFSNDTSSNSTKTLPFSEEMCSGRKSNQNSERKVIVTQNLEVTCCFGFYADPQTQALPDCSPYEKILLNIDKIYNSMTIALFEENKMLLPYKNSSLTIFVLGRIEQNSGSFDDEYLFFKFVNSKINIIGYSDSQYFTEDANVIVTRQSSFRIFIANVFTIKNITFTFNSLVNEMLFTGFNFFSLENIPDLPEFVSPEIYIESCQFRAESTSLNLGFITLVRFSSSSGAKLVWKNSVLENFSFENRLIDIDEQYLKNLGSSPPSSKINIKSLVIKNCKFTKGNLIFNFNQIFSQILIDEISLINTTVSANYLFETAYSNSYGCFIRIQRIFLKSSNLSTLIKTRNVPFVSITDIVLENANINKSPFIILENGEYFSLYECKLAQSFFNYFNFIDSTNIKEVILGNHSYVYNTLLESSFVNSVILIKNSVFINDSFKNSLIKTLNSIIILHKINISDVSEIQAGSGSVLNINKGSLFIFFMRMVNAVSYLIINYQDLVFEIIAHSQFSNLYKTQYFWTRSVKIEKMLFLNISFERSNIFRFHVLYNDKLVIRPVIVFKESLFSDIRLGSRLFDYCCVDFFSIDNKFIDIVLLNKSQTIGHLQQDGHYLFQGAYIFNVGGEYYELLTSGGYYKNFIFLWYEFSFSLFNSSFETTKDLSLQTGFLVSDNCFFRLIIQDCIFVVGKPNKYMPVRGILLFSIKEITIINCLFKNFIADNRASAFVFKNGVLSLFGSPSFSEKKANLNRVNFTNITIINSEALNGAGITIMSYNELVVLDCKFINGSAENGWGGSIALNFVKNLTIQGCIFFNASANQGGHLFLQDTPLALIKNCSFDLAQSYDSGSALFLINIYAKFINVNGSQIWTRGVGGFLYFSAGGVEFHNLRLTNVSAVKEGGLMYLEGGEKVLLNEARINDCRSFRGSISGFLSILAIESTMFDSFWTESEGSILIFDSFRFLSIQGSIFSTIECGSNCIFGVITVTTLLENAAFIMGNISFFRTSNSKSSILYVLSDLNLKLEQILIFGAHSYAILVFFGIKANFANITRLYIMESVIKSPAMINFKNVLGFLMESSLIENIFQTYCIKASSSSLTLRNLNFFENKKSEEPAQAYSMLFWIDCNIHFEKVMFLNKLYNSRVLLDADFLILMILSSTNITLAHLQYENFAFSQILKADDSSLNLTSCKFSNRNLPFPSLFAFDLTGNLASSISISNCLIFLTNKIIFNVNSVAFLHIESSYISGILPINDSLNQLEMDERKAIAARNLGELAITNCNLNSLRSEKGAAFKIYNYPNPLKILLENSSFINAKSAFGGVFFVEANFSLFIKRSFFKGNEAQNSLNVFGGVGGVGILICLNGDSLKCLVSVERCEFINNFASQYAANLFSDSPIIFKGDQQANISHFSYPIKLGIMHSGKKVEFVEVKSGETQNLTLNLLDAYNQILTFDGGSQAKLQVDKSSNQTVSTQNGINFSQNGVIRFNYFSIKAPININLTLNVIIKYISDPFNRSKEAAFSLPIKIKPCSRGEIVQMDYSCKRCDKGTYVFDNSENISRCKKCLENFDCFGGDEIYPKPGFWRQSKYDTEAVKCLIEEACLGGYKENMNDIDREHGACAEGHQGNICFDCKQNFGKFKFKSLCRECEGQSTLFYLRMIGMCVLILILIFLITYFSMRKTTKKKVSLVTNQGLDMSIFTLIFSHIQTFSVITFMEDFSLFPLMADVASFQSQLSFINQDFLTFECLMNKTPSSNLQKSIIVIVLPVILSSMSFVIWVILGLIYFLNTMISNSQSVGKSKLGLTLFRRFLLSFAIACYLLYPMILQTAFSLPNCIEFRNGLSPSKYYLYVDPSIECWTESHFLWIFFLFLPTLGIWGVLFPWFLLYILRIGKKVEKSQSQTLKEGSASQNQPNFLAVEFKMFRFFYEKYNDENFFWEIIVFIKKFLLTGLSSIKNLIGEDLKLMLIIFVLMAYNTLITNKKPYKVQRNNLLDFASGILIIITTLFLSLLNFEKENDLVNKNIVAYFVILANIAFILMPLAAYSYSFLAKKVRAWKILVPRIKSQKKNKVEKYIIKSQLREVL